MKKYQKKLLVLLSSLIVVGMYAGFACSGDPAAAAASVVGAGSTMPW